MKKNTTKTVWFVILWLVIVFVLVALIAFVLRFSNNGTDEFKTFYVGQNGKVFATKDSVELIGGSKAEFDVKYTFDFVQKEKQDFNVRVVTAADEGFDYTAGDEWFAYRDGIDVSEAFELEKDVQEGRFSITVPMSMKEVLTSLHGEDVMLDDEPDMSKTAYFKALVTSYNGEKVIELSMLISRVVISGVELDVSEIVF